MLLVFIFFWTTAQHCRTICLCLTPAGVWICQHLVCAFFVFFKKQVLHEWRELTITLFPSPLCNVTMNLSLGLFCAHFLLNQDNGLRPIIQQVLGKLWVQVDNKNCWSQTTKSKTIKCPKSAPVRMQIIGSKQWWKLRFWFPKQSTSDADRQVMIYIYIIFLIFF